MNSLFKEGNVEKRKLGRSGLEFAPIAFGGNVFGWTVDEAKALTLAKSVTLHSTAPGAGAAAAAGQRSLP